MAKMEDGHVTETAVEARAGFLDRPVAWVLITSITLVVVAFAAALRRRQNSADAAAALP